MTDNTNSVAPVTITLEDGKYRARKPDGHLVCEWWPVTENVDPAQRERMDALVKDGTLCRVTKTDEGIEVEPYHEISMTWDISEKEFSELREMFVGSG